jgi:predicted dehydrogenase
LEVQVMTGHPHPKLALVGCGEWGQLILRDLRALNCDVHVVARGQESRGRAQRGEATSIVEAMSDLPDVDGIVVCTPTPSHAEVVGEALGRGVPVFVEKPLVDDVADAERLASKAGGRLFVMDKWRYHSGVLALAEIARTGELGPVRGMRTVRTGWGNPHSQSHTPWNLAPHDLSIVLEILGEIPEPRFALAERVGSTTTGLVGWLGRDPWAVIEVSSSNPRRERSVRLICAAGSALLSDSYSDHLLVIRGDPQTQPEQEPERRPLDETMPLLAELTAFVEHLRGGPPPLSSAQEGARNVEVLSALMTLAGAGDDTRVIEDPVA